MDRVAPKAHLSVLICVLVADLVSLALLRWQLIRFRSKSDLFRRPQTWILILKCVLDSALVSLMVMDTSRGVDDGERFGLAVDLLFRFSISCVSIAELLFTRCTFPKVSLHHFGWWWRKCGPIGTVFLILLKFLPLIGYSHASAVGPAYAEPDCSLHKDVLHFWTVFSAIIIEYLLFSVLYWWAFYQNYPKWTAGRVAIPMSCSAAVLVASVFLMMQRKLLSVQYLLLASFLLLITFHLLIRSVHTEYVFFRARTEGDQRVPGMTSDQSARVLNNDIDRRKPSTSTSRKPLSQDIGNSMELYAWSISEIHVAKDQGMSKEEKIVYTRSLYEGKGDIDSADITVEKSSNSRDLHLSLCATLPEGWHHQMINITPDSMFTREEPTSTGMVGKKDNTGALTKVECESRNGDRNDQRSGSISKLDSDINNSDSESGLCNSTALNKSSSLDLPLTQKTKMLMVINLQNDSFSVPGGHCLTISCDFVPRLTQAIPYFRKDGGIICWVCTDLDQGVKSYTAGINGAEICGELLDVVDKEKDLMVTKHHYSAFEQTALLEALRMNLAINHIYLCGSLTDVDIHSIAADAVRHGLHVTIVEDCLGFRSVEDHEEAKRQMTDIMGVDGIECEGMIMKSGG